MKDIYVNKDGIICACTVEVPKAPEDVCRQCEGKGWITGIERPCGSCNPGGEWRSSKTTYQKYNAALHACKESAVPFDEKFSITVLLIDSFKDTSGKTMHEVMKHKIKPDTFYQINCDWEIVEVFSHCTPGEKHYKKVARLKVPAPTVATDNSGEEELCSTCGEERYSGSFKAAVCSNSFHLPIKASPVEEDQNKLWKELIDFYDIQDASSYGYGVLINKLSEKFILTRKK